MSRIAAYLFASSLFLPFAADAQGRSARLTASAGVDAVLYDGSKRVPGYIGQVGGEWRPGSSRGALRLNALRYQKNRADRSDWLAGCSDTGTQCTVVREYDVSGLNLDGTFDLTRGRFRPYLLSGAGAYHSVTREYTRYNCVSICTEPEYPSYASRRSAWSGGMHSGLGLSFDIGRRTAFTELKVLLLATDGMNARGMIPVTFGVKF